MNGRFGCSLGDGSQRDVAQSKGPQHAFHLFVCQKLNPLVAAFVQPANSLNRNGAATGDVRLQLGYFQLYRLDGLVKRDALGA